MPKRDHPEPPSKVEVSRRGFLKGAGAVLSSGIVAGAEALEAANSEGAKVIGPGKAPVTLKINGVNKSLNIEPRLTLLDALRDELELTGAKRVCDRTTCGACTVIVNGKSVYSCSMLAIEAQGKDIQTVEGLSKGNTLHPLQQAFVDNDAQQCGYCTPGFVMACKAFLDKNPNPSIEQVRKGLGGNLCRCGTYVGITEAVLQTAKKKGGRANA
ncbi:MAG TPA: (2Fe-2S)-binding protein [Terriglobia bacterium]|jgi:xanthine dehydrogenase YagT iron-sulfur-binding subunit|nr:(2Fe-2S)-binding protein [Terriglobia bacterium]